MKTYLHFDDPRRTREGEIPPVGYQSPSDAELIRYVERYWLEFRSGAEQYFGDLVASLPAYANYPYASTIIRFGPQGVLTLYKPADEAGVSVLRVEDCDPAFKTLEIAKIPERLGATTWTFDGRFRSYNDDEARIWGALNATNQALSVFWQGIELASFEGLCRDLALAEGLCVNRAWSGSGADDGLDLLGKVFFDEPGRIVREETWGFQIKHHDVKRPSASLVRETVARLGADELPVDILCIVSVGGLTSIGRNLVSENARVRVWDRTVMDNLLRRHPEIMRRYFRPYAEALERLHADRIGENSAEAKYRAALEACPAGLGDYKTYEDLGVEMLSFLFPSALGKPRPQSRTHDGVERRDVVCRNNQGSRFFQRVGVRFDADFVIWDFKNYGEPVTGAVINDVATYANPAMGRLIVVVSRRGAGDSVRAAQLRRFRNDQTMILVVSDQQLLEMVRRKESGEAPEDVLEDLLDEIVAEY